MNIRLTNDLVLIRRLLPAEPRSEAGLYLPPVEESVDTPWQGEVMAIGPGKPVRRSGAAEGVLTALKDMVYGDECYTGDASMRAAAVAVLEAHGEKVDRTPMQVKIGDKVIFSKNLFQEFRIDGETLIAMGESSILGVLEN